jgi:hypothetical protein
MRRIRQLLAVHFGAGASTRAIGQALGIAPSTVLEYLARATAAGTLTEEVAAWPDSRNKKHVKTDWQFTTADARVKLKRLHPAMGTTRGTRPDVRLR